MFNEPAKTEVSEHFTRQEYPTIMNGRVIRYRLKNRHWDGEINASRDGWSIQGHWPIMSASLVDEFCEVVRLAATAAELKR